ncbi:MULTISPECIES: O-methyltransferase [unclassified Janthinobacterium]|uniref:O-methyltransferase n=1 Tax=unclassified Janthinobacterium TaxID=2610881 RepID=UPI000C4CA500|nr:MULTISPECIES: class I SAM-dependent methyltransferase [unclassified Janthinobacterium]MDN2670725.1 class I SAM-dependent methyltransferase [Janthinobacterium sp. SUN026]MDN2715693.1 class I SAM-dependent methyltransferase [Janthinobacterium sp. SUN120]MDO8037930.1 class I SAM-dependent methyltransferase [Janthinobacterium sp. SUN137]MDO8066341.1 class I SAM-dependent methyltransferase [Janthinobacterium sp. SUN206]PIF12043.1 putative O-methyltransferase YrrM [Janthinobacterium sp. 13]
MHSIDTLDTLLSELEAFGNTNDAAHTERASRMLNITRDTGELLAVLVHARGARRVLEIGTSNGYSTLWLARAVQPLGGSVVTVEKAQDKFDMAHANFVRAQLQGVIGQLLADAGDVLRDAADGAYDFIFLDSARQQYESWWPQLDRVLAAGGVLVVDNASSHYADMAGFIDAIRADSRYTACLATVGKGEFIAVKAGN